MSYTKLHIGQWSVLKRDHIHLQLDGWLQCHEPIEFMIKMPLNQVKSRKHALKIQLEAWEESWGCLSVGARPDLNFLPREMPQKQLPMRELDEKRYKSSSTMYNQIVSMITKLDLTVQTVKWYHWANSESIWRIETEMRETVCCRQILLTNKTSSNYLSITRSRLYLL